MTRLRATARLQLHAGFNFEAAAAQLPYYAALGVSHLYLSPISAAMPGSMHGYDGIDPARINPELGGEEAFQRLATAARAHGMGLILDIVPNHLAASPQTPWWNDVLLHGCRSPHAGWFDIDWEAPGCEGRLWLPVLDRPLHDAVRDGVLRVAVDDERPTLRHHGLALPLSPRSHPLAPAQWPAWAERCNRSVERLHTLLQRQHYRLAWWRTAADQVNYRRFFDINELAALRVERDDVFAAVHALPLRLVRAGWVDGLRIDHVDGLSSPGPYLQHLRASLDAACAAGGRDPQAVSVHVEKILAEDEQLPDGWACDGTTGYDFMDQVGAWLHDPAAAPALSRTWQAASGDARSFDDLQQDARSMLLRTSLHTDFQRLLRSAQRVLQPRLAEADIGAAALARALAALLRHYRTYRPYSLQDAGERKALVDAAAAAREALDGTAHAALDLLLRALPGEAEAERALRVRFGQLAAPLNAKSVEDTGFYRYFRLLSRNEVGSDPQRLGMEGRELLEHAVRRLQRHPRALLALATHDHKRGADSRARLAVLSTCTVEWRDAVRRWSRMSTRAGAPMPLPGAEAYALWEALVAAWPMHGNPGADFASRMVQWLTKALREGKRVSSWSDPNVAVEEAAAQWLHALLDGAPLQPVREALATFVARIAPAGACNGLAQLCLQHCLPGVPDLYQGGEGWDLSLVDPDNRRAVDYPVRQAWLRDTRGWPALLEDWRDGGIKAFLLRRLLECRRRHPQLFLHGQLQPLSVPARSPWLAFARRHQAQVLLVIVRRGSPTAVPGPSLHAAHDVGTGVMLHGLPTGPMRNLLDGRIEHFKATGDAARLLAGSPLAVWINEETDRNGQQGTTAAD
ncbi:TPA: malto-oligosyltrehalose synthase [Stenotrophomonas maltophilia]|uniref:malto-oligosyltrehalose synthase n=1 Tax=Stenotrophomonas sp. PE591 TaxID=1812490 RepID=UPI001BAE98AA|nr:malto-oligosyltrehalose synthase [Stenotrophomonas sp. PE591]MBS3727166.1 Maltooligosyl trehalose synthase [Stenotrophomonas sp. PE591]